MCHIINETKSPFSEITSNIKDCFWRRVALHMKASTDIRLKKIDTKYVQTFLIALKIDFLCIELRTKTQSYGKLK